MNSSAEGGRRRTLDSADRDQVRHHQWHRHSHQTLPQPHLSTCCHFIDTVQSHTTSNTSTSVNCINSYVMLCYANCLNNCIKLNITADNQYRYTSQMRSQNSTC